MDDKTFDMAMQFNNFNYISKMVENGYEINKVRNDLGTTILNAYVNAREKAIKNKDKDIMGPRRMMIKISELVSVGADITTTDNKGLSPIIIAVLDDDIELIKFFLSCYPDLSVLYNNTSIFDIAVLTEKNEIVNLLLSTAEQIEEDSNLSLLEILNPQSCKGREKIKLHLENKVNFIKKEQEKFSEKFNVPLTFNQDINFEIKKNEFIEKCKFGSIKEVKESIQNTDINYQDSFGYSGLMWAIEFKNDEIINFLIDNGINVNLISPKNGVDALTIAVFMRKYNLVKRLIRLGATVNNTEKDLSCLAYAIKNNNYDIVEFLIDNGADVNAACIDIDKVKTFPIFFCNDIEIMNLLVKNNAKIDIKDGNGTTVLCSFLVVKNKNGLCRYLLSAGANPNYGNDYILPLTVCCYVNNVEGLKLLINANANINQTVSTGDTALNVAIYYDNYECAKLLLENGANIYLKNSDGDTAITIAKSKDNKNILNLLQKYISEHK